jgi:hypothetical protein
MAATTAAMNEETRTNAKKKITSSKIHAAHRRYFILCIS